MNAIYLQVITLSHMRIVTLIGITFVALIVGLFLPVAVLRYVYTGPAPLRFLSFSVIQLGILNFSCDLGLRLALCIHSQSA